MTWNKGGGNYTKGSNDDWWKAKDGDARTKVVTRKCYMDNHKPIELGGGTFLGGNCGTPVVDDYDIYIGLDDYAYKSRVPVGFPWTKETKTEGPEFDFAFPIVDMSVPKSVVDFKNMIDWLQEQLSLGKKVHVGCIGGHGRTGIVLTALIAQIEGEKDAIQKMRKIYCDRAVESAKQVAWLMKHYGVSKALGAKEKLPNATPAKKPPQTSRERKPEELRRLPASGTIVTPENATVCIFNSLTNAKKMVK